MAIRSRTYSNTGNELPFPQIGGTKRYHFYVFHCRLQFYKVIKLRRDRVHLRNMEQSILDIQLLIHQRRLHSQSINRGVKEPEKHRVLVQAAVDTCFFIRFMLLNAAVNITRIFLSLYSRNKNDIN